MKKFIEPEIDIVKIEATDIICESVDYYTDNEDFIGWG